jgi:hypothetical protein
MWFSEATAKKDIPGTSVKAGDKITLTKGILYKYSLWCEDGVFDLPAKYVKIQTNRTLIKKTMNDS